MTKNKRFPTSGTLLAFLTAGAVPLGQLFAQDDDLPPILDVTSVIGDRVEDFASAPISATVLDASEIDNSIVGSPQSIASVVPNLTNTDAGTRSYGDVYSVRGLTNTPFFSSPSVAFYVDDIPFGDAFSYAHQLNLVNSVEVFRGPQHTVFGRYTYGGVINVVSRRPGGEAEGSIAGTIGSDGYRGLDASLMGPLGEEGSPWSFRLGGTFASRDGFLTHALTGDKVDSTEHGSGNLALFYNPGTGLDVSFIASVDEFNDGAPRLNSLLAPDPWTVASNVAGVMHRSANNQAVRVGYEGNGYEFVSVSARRDWSLDPYTFDLDFSPQSFGETTILQDQLIYSQEFRIKSIDEGASFGWNGGAYAHQNDGSHNGYRAFVDPTSGFAGEETTMFDLNERSLALFGQVDYHATDLLTVYAGARIDYVEKDIDRLKQSVFGDVPIALEDDYTHFGPKVGFDYWASHGVLLYGNSSYAFKPGGFSGFVDTPDFAAYDSEKTWANEIGVKVDYDTGLAFNLSGFYYDIQDYQVERTFSVVDYAVFNAADASSYGLELEGSLDLAPGLRLLGSVGYTHVELERYTDPVSGAVLDGNTAPFVPDYDATLALDYRAPNCGFFARAELLAVGDTYFDDSNSAGFEEDAYMVFNASVGYGTDEWSITFYGLNLTDEFFYTNKSTDIMAGTQGAPLTTGVRFSIDF